jgi:hypothetical protein
MFSRIFRFATLMLLPAIVLAAACSGDGGGTTPTPTATPASGATATPSGTPSAAVACPAQDLAAETAIQGAAGHRLGSITFTNTGTAACELQGRPDLSIVDSAGTNLTDQQSPAAFAAELAGDPTVAVVVAPGGTAQVNFDWTNVCAAPVTPPLTLKIILPNNQGELDSALAEQTGPGCVAQGQPSAIGTGAFIATP